MSLLDDQRSKLLHELNSIVSEGQNPETLDIDLLATDDILYKLNDEDHKVAPAVRAIIPDIAKAVDAIVHAFSKGARLIYIGAGTSGRLGILDASECPPTFSVDPSQQWWALLPVALKRFKPLSKEPRIMPSKPSPILKRITCAPTMC